LPPLSDDAFWNSCGLLAKWFHFQPSEIYELDWIDFKRWVKQAIQQVEERARAYRA
jgi:hypothetical protein